MLLGGAGWLGLSGGLGDVVVSRELGRRTVLVVPGVCGINRKDSKGNW